MTVSNNWYWGQNCKHFLSPLQKYTLQNCSGSYGLLEVGFSYVSVYVLNLMDKPKQRPKMWVWVFLFHWVHNNICRKMFKIFPTSTCLISCQQEQCIFTHLILLLADHITLLHGYKFVINFHSFIKDVVLQINIHD